MRAPIHKMPGLTQICLRLSQSAVVWSWVMNGLRLTAGIVVLPLLAIKLAKPDFDIYFVFLSLAALAPILDLGFGASVGRAVSYAMGGAKDLKAQGFAPEQDASGPNHDLLQRLLQTTRQLYRLLSLGALLLLGSFGTMMIVEAVAKTTTPALTWAAWGLTLASVFWELYAGWWNVFLRSMNQVLASTQQSVLAQAVRIALCCALLLVGAGLLSMPIATLVSSLLQRHLARRRVRRLLGGVETAVAGAEVRSMVATLWPNTWRVGLLLFSGYLAGQAATLICLQFLGLAAAGAYGLSLQLILICSSMAQVWTMVKWPLIGQLRIKQDNESLRRLIRPLVRLQYLTYAALAAAVFFLAPALIEWTGSDKTLLPLLWLGLLAARGILDLDYTFWTTLITTENRMPFFWPIIISNLAIFLLTLALLHTTSLGFGAMVLSPLAVNALCNYWKWPREGARGMGTTWIGFMFRRAR